jgi:membrane protease YdiL (CAAX protease family)
VSAPQAAPGIGRLVFWLVVASLSAVAAYGTRGVDLPADFLYRYSTFALGTVQLLFTLAIVRLATGPRRNQGALALRPPHVWRWALVAAGVVVAADLALQVIYVSVVGGEDQGIISTFWDGSRAPQFALNFILIAILVPVSEELLYRGIGYSLLARFGPWTAILATGMFFALAHGMIVALPLFIAYGIALGWLRFRTGSVYPGMLVHGTSNALAVILAVTFG